MKANEWLEKLRKGEFDGVFARLYSDNNIAAQKARYENAVNAFLRTYPERGEDIFVFSAPGRTEIGGNHTDHQHGCVLAAAVDLDVIAVAAPNDDDVILVRSEGYEQNIIGLSDLGARENEKGTPAALIRGICAKFAEAGAKPGGFDAYITSDVLSGSGLSSSAAFEILIGTILNELFAGNKFAATELAKIGQFAENVYYGKQSGLMDQMTCAVGGCVFIDFADAENPIIKRQDFEPENFGYKICVTDTRGSHSDLSGDYVEIREEMQSAARFFGKEFLREVDENEFYEKIAGLRSECSERAVLRALHFIEENRRAALERRALENENIEYFLDLVRKSGQSSAFLLQNLYSVKKPKDQKIPLAIIMSERFLDGRGAVRVHGGGFAGTVQAFVPSEKTSEYSALMEKIFGAGCCYKIKIRPCGGVKIC